MIVHKNKHLKDKKLLKITDSNSRTTSCYSILNCRAFKTISLWSTAKICNTFVVGDLLDFDAVYNFGKTVDVLTIEIENVNLDALDKLE